MGSALDIAAKADSAERVLAERSFEAHAVFVGERIDLRTVAPRLASHPIVVEVGDGGWAALFRYGAVVMFNVPQFARERFIDDLRPRISDPYEQPEHESVRIRVTPGEDEGVLDGDVVVREASLPRIQVVAEILAKSIVLAQYEAQLATVFNAVEPLAAQLETRGRGGRQVRELLRHIGGTLLIQHKMVGRVQVLEKPELLWERSELERFYLRLEDEFEIVERHHALERKLELINSTAATALELVQARRSHRVEWYIVILIVVEIVLTLYELFFHKSATLLGPLA